MEKQIYADTSKFWKVSRRFYKDHNSQGQYDEAKEKKLQMDDFRVEVYKTLEITDLLELQGGPRNH